MISQTEGGHRRRTTVRKEGASRRGQFRECASGREPDEPTAHNRGIKGASPEILPPRETERLAFPGTR